MQANIFLPKKINVGFQSREHTFTGKLAYVIYYDEKGTLRKETSWSGWRDNDIDNEVLVNEPLEGFVLNKKAGGYSSGWNYRQSYIRVYDPRGFEFEITVENLLYILENTNSIKGKGLEGEFIYGWDGGDLVLLPTGTPEYQDILAYNKTRHSNKKIGVKDLVVGGTYKTKNNENYVYMGKFTKWDYEYRSSGDPINLDKGKHHFFCKHLSYGEKEAVNTIMVKSPSGRFIDVVSEDPPVNFADIFELLERTTDYSPKDPSKTKFIQYTIEELKESFVDQYWRMQFYNEAGDKFELLRADENRIDSNSINEKLKIIKNTGERGIRNNYQEVDKGYIEDLYSRNDIYYKNIYLENGKLYEEGK